MSLNFEPTGNRVVVRLVDASEKTAGGLFIPATTEREQRVGIVVAAPAKYIAGALVLSSPFCVGDRVLVDSLGATKMDIDGETLHVVRHEDIIGRFTLQ